MVWPSPWEYSSWWRPFNQGSFSGRPHSGTRDRESTWSNSQAMDSALWSCDHTPLFSSGPSGQGEYTGDVAHIPRCCSPPICKVSSAVPSGHGAPRGSSTCRWFWEVHQPRILHYPPNKQVLGSCLDWHDNRTSAYRRWWMFKEACKEDVASQTLHWYTSSVLFLIASQSWRLSRTYQAHHQHPPSSMWLTRITRNADQHARTGMPHIRQVHQLAEDTQTRRPKYQTKLISVFSGMSADETINCDRADEVGSELQKAMVGKNFAELTLPLSAMTSTIKVRGEAVVIDQQQMLNRVFAVIQSGRSSRTFSSMNLSTMPHPFRQFCNEEDC